MDDIVNFVSPGIDAEASTAKSNLMDRDALFSFIGHGWLGYSGLVFYTEPGEFDPNWVSHGSLLATNTGDGSFQGAVEDVEALGADDLQDVGLAVLNACEPGDTSPLLRETLLSKGVDVVVAGDDLVHYVAIKHFNREFWECVNADKIPGTGVDADIDPCVDYAKDEAHRLTLLEQGQSEADSINVMDLYPGSGLNSRDLRVVPAHFGKRSN